VSNEEDPDMTSAVFEAGPNQIIVVYSPADTGAEIDVSAAFGAIASDAADRFTGGWRMVSTAALPTRHAQAFVGREGSGYETKMSVVVVYSKP
jgi:hypothetical protein